MSHSGFSDIRRSGMSGYTIAILATWLRLKGKLMLRYVVLFFLLFTPHAITNENLFLELNEKATIAIKTNVANLFVLLSTPHVNMDKSAFSGLNGETAIVVKTNIAYGPDLQETMDLCLPESPRQASPILLLIHGGGWAEGDKVSYLSLCKKYAANGIAAATINYRLFNITTRLNQWPAQIVDAQLAVRWIRAHAQELNLDSKKICAYGDSAGGHLALLLGLLLHKWVGDHDEMLSSESSSVSCVVDNFGPTDLQNGSFSILERAKELVPIDKHGKKRGALYSASPLYHVHSLAAPTLIIQGRDDKLVPRSQSILLRDEMVRNGVHVAYLEYLGDHQYNGLSGEDMQEIREIQSRFIFYMLYK